MQVIDLHFYLKCHSSTGVFQTFGSKIQLPGLSISGTLIEKKNKKKQKLYCLFFMDGVQLPQGYSHFEETVYFLPFFLRKWVKALGVQRSYQKISNIIFLVHYAQTKITSFIF